MFSHLYFTDIIEIKHFLDTLEIDKVYVATFEFHLSDLSDNEDPPVITLSKPILLTKNSNPTLISKFILNQIRLADDKFSLDYDLILELRLNNGAPYILRKYNEINIF
jgi:hypothetical protein